MCFLYLVLAVLTLLYFYLKSSYTYWSKRGVYNPPTIFPFGNAKDLLLRRKTVMENWQSVYDDIKRRRERFGGGYTLFNPVLIPTSPDFFRLIFTKNFDHFHDRGTYVNEKEPLTMHLVNLEGQKWKKLRAKLTPTFSSGKLKGMFCVFLEVSEELGKKLEESIGINGVLEKSEVLEGDKKKESVDIAEESVDVKSENPVKMKEPVDIKNLLARYTTDVIGRCAFGIDCNSLKDPETPFYKAGLKIFRRGWLKNLRVLLSRFKPEWFKKTGLRMSDESLEKFFFGVVKDVISERKSSGVRRDDFMDTLIGMLERGGEDGLNLDEVVAQTFVFFAAGFETSASAMTFILLELALNQSCQDKVREEIMKVVDGKEVTYEDIGRMVYLECVIEEALRKYPPFPVIPRKCTKSFEDPESGFVVPQGSTVFALVYSLHHDEDFFPNPEVFDPERFLPENKKNIIPYSYMPFGEGPRICIGMRFAIIQMKATLAKIIPKYKFFLNERTSLPVKFDSGNVALTVEGNVWLDVELVKN